MRETQLKLSIVIPCYNEQECISELYRRVTDVAKSVVGNGYELILVNDGSRDQTWPMMQSLSKFDPALVCVNLSRNHGHQLALTAGLTISRGERIFVVDADMQDPPELLVPMMAKADEGFDVVYGKRVHRAGETLFKKASAALFYRWLASMTEVTIPTDTGDFRLMSRRALNAFLAMPEQHRFVRGMVSWIGFPQCAFDYRRAERFAGETKYPLSKMIKLAVDAITGFSTKPLRLASYLGMIMALVGIGFIFHILYGWMSGDVIPGWTSTIAIITIVGSTQLLVLGVIGEYLGRLYIETKKRPLFLIADIVSTRPHPSIDTPTLGFMHDPAGSTAGGSLEISSTAS
jgi:polyisoprenyl-phosphate glycosyltransferase